MKLWHHRVQYLKGGLSGAILWLLAGGLLSLAIILIGEWILNVKWTEDRVFALLAWVIAAPALIWAAIWVVAAIRLSGDSECPVCRNELSNCICCLDCEGRGTTDVVAKMNNWFLPDACTACNGSGDENVAAAVPPDSQCALCGESNFGKHVNVVQTSYAGGPTTSVTERHEWHELARLSPHICIRCGKGCISERDAEDKIARKLTLQSPDRYEGWQTQYWGERSWDEQPKIRQRL